MKLKLNELRTEGENKRSIMAFVKVPSAKYQIYIPSKGRASNCITANVLLSEGSEFQIVVEPQDFEEYKKYYADNLLLKLPKNNMGIGYVRAFIKTYATENNQSYYWQLDDDLKFKKRIDDNNVYHSALDIFCEIEKYVDEHKNIGIASLRNQVFAWTLKTELTLNIQCCAATLVNTKMEAQYQSNIVEDTDFNMQVLTSGLCTVTFDKLLFMTGTPSKLKGGCSGAAYYDKLTEYQENFVSKWGNSFVINKTKDGTKLKGKGIWKSFKQKPIKNK
jgi:hypothetical protein